MAIARKELTAEHKAALERGRVAGRSIKAYLTRLEGQSQRRSTRTSEQIGARLHEIEAAIAAAPPIKRIALLQERIDLNTELEARESLSAESMAELEDGFIAHAARYSQAKGISHRAWREFGVPGEVLQRAGITIP